jgi:predicted ATPase
VAREVVVLSEHLVGRQAEVDTLDHALDMLDRAQSSALAVVGEPGIGKTRLLAELAVRAEDRGWLVVSGSAGELERDLPYWVFVDALEEFVRGLEPRRLAVLDDDVRVEPSPGRRWCTSATARITPYAICWNG